MVRILFLLCLALAGIGTAQVPTLIQIYVSDPLKWERGQRPGQPAPPMAVGQVLALESNGMLAIVYAYLYRQGGQTHILYQEGYSVASGTWRIEGSLMKVRYKVIYANVPGKGQAPSEMEESWKFLPSTDRGHLARRIDAKPKFIPLEDLADAQRLSAVIASHRMKALP